MRLDIDQFKKNVMLAGDSNTMRTVDEFLWFPLVLRSYGFEDAVGTHELRWLSRERRVQQFVDGVWLDRRWG